MRRMLPYLCAVLLLLPLAAASARAQDGPAMTTVRQLDLAAQHLATTAERDAKAGTLSQDQADRLEDLAALARGFRFDLEANQYSSIQARVAWDEVADTFVAARKALGKDGSKALRNEVLRVHSLMNRLDIGLGGPGFWYGSQGWPG